MSESLEDRLARLGDEAEAGELDQSDRPIPAHVKVSRPNRARSKVLQVRLSEAEFAAIERVAEGRGLPPSTVAREQLLRLVAEAGSAGSPEEALQAALMSISSLVAQMTELTARVHLAS